MKQTKLNFSEITPGLYRSQEIVVNDDFNLHLDRDRIGKCIIFQKTAGSNFGKGTELDPTDSVIDIDLDGIIYPKTIYVESGSPVADGYVSEDE